MKNSAEVSEQTALHGSNKASTQHKHIIMTTKSNQAGKTKYDKKGPQ